MKKIIIIIILIAVIGVVWWLSAREEDAPITPVEPDNEVVVEDEVVSLLDDIEQGIGIDFSEIQDVEFQWFSEDGSKTMIQGKGIGIEKISDEQYLDVESFFKNNDFKIDNYNISSGTVVGAIGYKKDDVVCLIVAGVSDYGDTNDVDIKCGEIEIVGAEQACSDSGGTVSTSTCCKATSDFPNLCLIGPCGCAPEHSHEVKICDCGNDCWDGTKCTQVQ